MHAALKNEYPNMAIANIHIWKNTLTKEQNGRKMRRKEGYKVELKELRELKAKMGITNKEIAELSGIPFSTVNKIFSGATKNPGYASLLAIEEVLVTKQKLPFTYDTLTEEPMMLREQTAPYGYRARHYQAKDVEALSESARAELINGMLYMLAAPSRVHQFLVSNLTCDIQNYIRKNRGACQVYTAPFDVRLFGDDSCTVQPDIAVVCKRELLTDKGCSGAPDWIIEITSAGNARHDYVTKMVLYQKAGIREYWVVDPAEGKVMVMNFENGQNSAEYAFSDPIPSGVLEELEICIADYME